MYVESELHVGGEKISVKEEINKHGRSGVFHQE
jgi:hypothetical protein